MITQTHTVPMAQRKAWTLVLASLGLFMVALDTFVVTTALPVLRVDLGASLSDLEWTVNAYNLAFACLLLTGAALGDRFGRRRMFTLGLVLFTAASAAAALSPSVDGADRRPRAPGCRCGRRHAVDADADQRGLPGREARHGGRTLGRHRRPRRRRRTRRRRRRDRRDRLALDLLAERPDRPAGDPARRTSPERELRAAPAARPDRAGARRRRAARPDVGTRALHHRRVGQRRGDRSARRRA